MSDEINRMMAHAVKALAESAQGIGGALREQIANSAETNRILAKIHDQNRVISDQLEGMNSRHNGSEKAIRVLNTQVDAIRQELARHDERIEGLEGQAGAEAEQLG